MEFQCAPNTSFCEDVGKNEWPELCGTEGNSAVATIATENGSVNPMIVKEGMVVTPDIRCDRVRVWVNDNGFVTRVPVVG
ncbi:hypothetical protein LguiA_031060 [Lonicera macranthoides]